MRHSFSASRSVLRGQLAITKVTELTTTARNEAMNATKHRVEQDVRVSDSFSLTAKLSLVSLNEGMDCHRRRPCDGFDDIIRSCE